MKKIAILIAAWLCFTNAFPQKITEKHINFSGKESLEFDIQIADSIKVQTWNKNEVYIMASVNVNDNKDNDAYQITFDESGNAVGVKANFNKDFFTGKKNCCNETDIIWQVCIPGKTSFSLETINGDITITGETQAMSVKTISGFIDLAVPSSKKADLEFSTISGTVYTNHSMAMNSGSKSHSSEIRDHLNNGGPLIKLGTISGNIFFRKAE